MPDRVNSSTGLSSPVAAVLAYSGWWVTGGIFLWFEQHDRAVRFHAAQAIVVFGLVAALIGLFAAVAIVSLSFLPSMFGFFAGAAALTWMAGVVLWGIAIWKAVSGDEWRIPVAADWAERLSAASRASAAALP